MPQRRCRARRSLRHPDEVAPRYPKRWRHRQKKPPREACRRSQGGKMTARNLLWIALGIVGLPLLIEGGSGCGFHSPGAAVIDDNAYTCGCRCAAGPASKTVRILANSDDAEKDGANVRLGGNDLKLGANLVGLRFTGIGIPHGATIM